MMITGGVTAAAVSFWAVPAGATTVSNEADFRTAWQNDTSIVLAADITLTCEKGSGTGEAFRSSTNGALTLDGQGHTITQSCPFSRVLESTSDDDITIMNVTVTGGFADDGEGGGGLRQDGDNTESLTITNSTFTNNLACENGGAVENDDSNGTLRVTGSTFDHNTATDEAGAIWMDHFKATVVNSTMTQNTGGTRGFVIEDEDSTDQPLTLIYTDIVNNLHSPGLTCPDAGGAARAAAKAPNADSKDPGAHARTDGGEPAIVAADTSSGGPAATLVAFGTVITGNLSGDPTDTNCDLRDNGTATSSYDLADDTTCGLTGTGDTQTTGADPHLGALADNGGPTKTLLPQTGSPLIDAIPVASCGAMVGIATDQRGVSRPQGNGCDIGAVEVGVVAAPAVVVQPAFTG